MSEVIPPRRPEVPTVSRVSGGAARFALAWFASGTLAFLLCFYDLSATLSAGEFVPAGHDDFYHGRRILAAIADPLNVIQFDSSIHAPEGSWVTWPWAFDTMMAGIAAAAMALTGIEPAMRVLAFIAPLWVFVNGALLLGICRVLGLGFPATGFVLLCFAISPLTRLLHGAGTLDHHFVEYTFVLLALLSGLRWFCSLDRRRRAFACAAVLGAAPAFHNGLFILQLPVLIALFVVRLAGRDVPRSAVFVFAAALPAVTLLFLLPSQPFREGMFSFYLHSSFHLYIAVCSALVTLAIAMLPRSLSGLALLVGGSALLSVPILAEIAAGGRFLSGDIVKYDSIIETHSVFRWLHEARFARINELYSGLVWLLPLTFAGLGWHYRRGADNREVYFVVASVFGALLLLTQFRLEYFGSFVLYVPAAVMAQRIGARNPAARGPLFLAACIAIVASHIPAFAALGREHPLGGDFQYAATRDVYPVLAKYCAREPGIVLAEHGDGHYITYHTQCAVVADNFILTPQHQQKVMFSESLMASDLADVLRALPQVRYILVRRADNINAATSCHPGCVENAGLREALFAADRTTSPRLQLVFEKRVRRGDRIEPLVRLFRIRPKAAGS